MSFLSDVISIVEVLLEDLLEELVLCLQFFLQDFLVGEGRLLVDHLHPLGEGELASDLFLSKGQVSFSISEELSLIFFLLFYIL